MLTESCLKPVGVRKQRTLSRPVQLEGVGLHTGMPVTLTLCPASEGFGIQFQRMDLPGSPLILATVEQVTSTERQTTLGVAEARVHTVEHLLAALAAYKIDNACVQLSAAEPPAAGGCALEYVRLIQEAGVLEQGRDEICYGLSAPLWWEAQGIFLAAFPSATWQVDYTLHYPEVPGMGTQYCSIVIDCDTFATELAPCRTFALYEEVEALRAAGLIKGGSMDNAVVIKDGAVVNEGGLRFANEMARHKVLDIVGDLKLVAKELVARIVAVRSGHRSNVAFAQRLFKHFSRESSS